MRLTVLALCALSFIPILNAQTAAGTIYYSGGSLPAAAAMNGQSIIVKNSDASGNAGSSTWVFTSNGTSWSGVALGGGASSAPSQGMVKSNGSILQTALAGTDYMAITTGVTSTQLPSIARGKTCEIHIWGSGTSNALQTADSEPNSCFNDAGTVLTITAVRCLADNGSTTTTVTPIITGGSATSILTGALTCGSGSFAAGTVNGSPTVAASGSIDANISAAGAAKSIRLVITGTF